MGGVGSGRSRGATDAVELLVAAVLNRDSAEAQKCVQKLDVAKRHGASKMTGARILRLVSKVEQQIGLVVQSAKANPKEHLGDVKVSLGDGSTVWIEVKGQTKKEKFADITQADYVRDGTDFLRAFAKANSKFDRLISQELRFDLGLDTPLTFTSKWSLPELWLADLALLETEDKKSRAGVRTPRDLAVFLDSKFLLHVSMEGARYLRLSDLRPVTAYRSGQKFQTSLGSNRSSAALIRVAVGMTPGRSTTDFTYHVGYKNAAGRHKLHDLAVAQSSKLTIVT